METQTVERGKRKIIPRVSGVTKDEMRTFLDRHSSQAVILTDIVSDWPAYERWTPEFLAESCGEDSLILSDNLAEPSVFKKRTFREYLSYIADPASHPLSREKEGVVWYAGYYSPFISRPELLNDFSVPECLGSWFEHLHEPMKEWYQNGFGWLLTGPAGTQTAAHFDLFYTHAWTAQLRGRKKFIFYPPDRQEPFDDLERILNQEPIEVILEEGDFMVIPADWCHAAESLEASFTLTYNFVNETNFSRFLQSTYLYNDKWHIKAKNPLLRHKMGLPVLEDE